MCPVFPFFSPAFSQGKFSFPPHHNTPTDEQISTTYQLGRVEERPNNPIARHLYDEEQQYASHRPRAYSAYIQQQHRQRIGEFAAAAATDDTKPRSYSTTRDCIEESGFLSHERITRKPRSYSFDAVGRSHQYYTNESHAPSASNALHHHAFHSLSPSQREQSADEGIGTSEGGSTDSLENSPTSAYKRKVSRFYFPLIRNPCNRHTTLK